MNKIASTLRNSIIAKLIASLVLILSLLVILSVQSLVNNARTKTTINSVEQLNNSVIQAAMNIDLGLFRLIANIKRISEQTTIDQVETLNTTIDLSLEDSLNLVDSLDKYASTDELTSDNSNNVLPQSTVDSLEAEFEKIYTSARKASAFKADAIDTTASLAFYRSELSVIEEELKVYFDDLFWEVDDDQSLIILKEFYASFLIGINYIKDIPSATTVEEVEAAVNQYYSWKASHQEQFLTVASVVARYPDFRPSVVRLTDMTKEFDALTLGVDDDALDSIYDLTQNLIQSNNAIASEIINTESVIPVAVGHVKELRDIATAKGQDLSTELNKTVTRSTQILIAATLISIIIVAVVSYYLVSSIRKPLFNIVTALRNLSEGNLAYSFGEHSNDEFGRISKGLDNVISNLHDLVSTIVRDAKTLNNLSHSSTDTMNATNEQVSMQADKVESVATAMEEMSQTVSEVSNEADGTKRVADEVFELSNDGSVRMRRSREEMSKLNNHIDNTLSVVNEMTDSVANIEKILTVIKTIAEQTNLLALNAAIEAARAGEQGRGFAVVADEVRGLANRTQQSTSEIQNYIETLNEHSQRAITAMSESKDLSDGANESVETLAEVMEDLSRRIEELNQTGSRISNIASEQNKSADLISQDVRDVANSGIVVKDSMSNLKVSVNDLLSISDSLRLSTDKFQLESTVDDDDADHETVGNDDVTSDEQTKKAR